MSNTKRPLLMHFSVRDQIFFAKRLSMIMRSGMPVREALIMLDGAGNSRSAQYVYTQLIEEVSRGQSLSAGLKQFDRIFGDFCINIVRVGETSGTLHESLNHLAEELKKKRALKSKVISALMYPMIVVVATIAITMGLTMYIFPKIIPIFQGFKTQLPLSTRILIGISAFLIKDGFIFLCALIFFAIALFFSFKTPKMQLWRDRNVLRIPIFGSLLHHYNLASISRTTGLLIKSDVRIVTALEIVARSTANRAYRDALEIVARRVLGGEKISECMQSIPHLFPSVFSQMVAAGERTGNLSGSLLYLSDMYEEEIHDLTKNLTTLLEPILMLGMGFVVGFIAVSIIAPIYGITQNLNLRS